MFVMCNKCGYFYDDATSPQCPQCSAKESNNSDLQQKEKPETKVTDNPLICPNCGGAVTADQEFCPTCFLRLKDFSQEKQEPAEEEEVIDSKSDIDNDDDHDVEREDYSVDSENDSASEGPIADEGYGSGAYSETERADSYEKSTFYTEENPLIANLKKYRKTALIVLGLIVLLVIIVSIIVSVASNKKIKIDLSQYISSTIHLESDDSNYNSGYSNSYGTSLNSASYSNEDVGAGLLVYGYDQYAYINADEVQNIVDWDRLQRDINEQLENKEFEGRSLSFYDFFDEYSFTFNADQYSNICNGDSIEITVSTLQDYTYGDTTIEISDCTVYYYIDSLEAVQAFDPFNYVTIQQNAANGFARARCLIDENLNTNIEGVDGFKITYYSSNTIAIEKDDYIIAKIRFYFDNDTSSRSDYKNGDTITMYCSSSNDDLADEYNLYIGVQQKEYTFNSLGDYITKSTPLSQEKINAFLTYSNAQIQENYSGYDYYTNFNFNSAYIIDLKDKTEQSDFHNDLLLVYSYVYEHSWSGEKETRYLGVTYRNLIMDASGNILSSPEEVYYNINNGFESIDEVLTYRYDEDYNIAALS